MPGTTPTPANYSNIVDEAVTQQYMRSEWDSTKEINPLLERLEKKGRIQFDASGKFVDLIARVGRWQASRRADLAQREFARKQHRVTYTFPYSFLEVIGILSERDLMFMSSPDARIRIQDQMLTEMGADFGLDINSRILTENAGSQTVGGNTAYAGGDVPLYGLPTIFGYGATAQDYDHQAKTTSGNVAAGDKEVLPNTTYGGVTTNPTSALAGVDNAITEATSPVIANWKSTAWDGSSTTWIKNGKYVITHLINRLHRGNGAGERPDLGIMTQAMYIDLKNGFKDDVSQQVVITEQPTAPDTGMYPRLFMRYEGVDLIYDLDQATDVFYLLNTGKLMLKVYPQTPAGNASGAIKGKTKELFKVAQMPDIDQGGHKVVATNVCQLIGEPRYQGMAFDFA
jgi:hypothetical protein